MSEEVPVPRLLTELPEARASGDVLRIYGEIKRLSAVPMVALIYRHLATIPGALEWSWALLEPVMRSGALQQRAWELASQANVDRVPRVSTAALRAVGLQAQDERAIAAVLDAYNRANPINILAVRCIALHLAAAVPASATAQQREVAGWEPPPAPAALPPMVDPSAMSPAVRDLAVLLTDRGPTAQPSPLWPSLYRNLAHWPAVLGYASVLVVPRFDEIDAAAARLRERMNSAALELAARMRAPADCEQPSPAEHARLHEAIDRFSGRIPEMVVIGRLLRSALPAPE